MFCDFYKAFWDSRFLETSLSKLRLICQDDFAVKSNGEQYSYSTWVPQHWREASLKSLNITQMLQKGGWVVHICPACCLLCHPGFILDSDKCFHTVCLAAALPAPRTQGTPCPGDRFPVYSAILGQKEEISMENTSLSLPLLSSLTLPQGSTNSPPPQGRPHLPACTLINVWAAETGHPSSTTTACAHACVCTNICLRVTWFTMWSGISSPTLEVTLNRLPPPWLLCRSPGWLVREAWAAVCHSLSDTLSLVSALLHPNGAIHTIMLHSSNLTTTCILPLNLGCSTGLCCFISTKIRY